MLRALSRQFGVAACTACTACRHSTTAEAFMALGVLADDKPLYQKGLQLARDTIADYYRWGNKGKIPGFCSETMRDMYHSQFGLGGLLQAAEIAWQQVRL